MYYRHLSLRAGALRAGRERCEKSSGCPQYVQRGGLSAHGASPAKAAGEEYTERNCSKTIESLLMLTSCLSQGDMDCYMVDVAAQLFSVLLSAGNTERVYAFVQVSV